MNKIALITGGSSGLGLSFAEILGSQGYHIVILARNKERIDNAILNLKNKNITASGITCDITSESDLKSAVQKVKSEYQSIDFLILNAGEVSISLLSDYTNTAELKKDIEIDLWGTVQTTYFFLPLMTNFQSQNTENKNKTFQSKILFISSGFGLMGAAGYSTYCAAKGGVVYFAESLRRELLCRNINVYTACTGDLDTPQFHYEIEHQPEWMKMSTPRKVMPPLKIASRILSKCHGSARFLILIGSDVKLLTNVTRIAPRTVRDKLIDMIMPRPK